MKALVLSALVVGAIAMADERQQQSSPIQLPRQMQQQVIQQLQRAGDDGRDLPRPQAAPGAERRLGPDEVNSNPRVSHYTHCLSPQNGFIEYISQESAFNPRAKFKISVKKGDESVDVDDARVQVSKHLRFDTTSSSNWGLGGKSETITKAYAVKMKISSQKHVLGHKIAGCIPQPIKEVEVTTICFDSATTWQGR